MAKRSLSELADKVGVAFLIVIGTVYFAQGFRTVAQLACMSYLKDDLQLEPAASQAMMSTALLPWSIKPIYGLLSDYFPLFGRRRKPYLVISGVLGTLSWALVSYVTSGTGDNAPTPWLLLVLFAIGNLSTAIADVIVDAMVAENSHGEDSIEDDLQSLCWKCMAVGGVCGSLVGGIALTNLGASSVFLMAAICPLMALVMSLILEEPTHIASNTRGKSWLTEMKLVFSHITSPTTFRVMAYLFFANAISPSFGQIFYFYVTEELKFSNDFLSLMGSAMWAMMIVGSFAGDNVITEKTSYRKAFWWIQATKAAASIFSLILVSRWNVAVGVPDHVFVAFSDSVETILDRIGLIPVLSISAKLTPVGVEATMFALFMSISNFSNQVGSYFGAYLCTELGVGRENYDNLPQLIFIRICLMCIPLLITSRCIPDTVANQRAKAS